MRTEQILPGSEGNGEQGEEMAQIVYAHRNKRIKKKKVGMSREPRDSSMESSTVRGGSKQDPLKHRDRAGVLVTRTSISNIRFFNLENSKPGHSFYIYLLTIHVSFMYFFLK
jgi:hypothetical protein